MGPDLSPGVSGAPGGPRAPRAAGLQELRGPPDSRDVTKTFFHKTETKTKTSVGKTETKTKTSVDKTETKTSVGKIKIETNTFASFLFSVIIWYYVK